MRRRSAMSAMSAVSDDFERVLIASLRWHYPGQVLRGARRLRGRARRALSLAAPLAVAVIVHDLAGAGVDRPPEPPRTAEIALPPARRVPFRHRCRHPTHLSPAAARRPPR